MLVLYPRHLLLPLKTLHILKDLNQSDHSVTDFGLPPKENFLISHDNRMLAEHMGFEHK